MAVRNLVSKKKQKTLYSLLDDLDHRDLSEGDQSLTTSISKREFAKRGELKQEAKPFEGQESILDSTAISSTLGKEDETIDLGDSKFVFPQKKQLPPKTGKYENYTIESYIHTNDSQQEFHELVAKYFESLDCQLLAPTKFKKLEKEFYEPGFELWNLPTTWEKPVSVFYQKIFFKPNKKIRYILSFPVKQPARQHSVKNEPFLSAQRLAKKMIRISEVFKNEYPIHMILFLKEPKSTEKKENVRHCATNFTEKVQGSYHSKDICQGFTVLTADHGSLYNYIQEKEREKIIERERASNEKEKKAIERHASLEREVAEDKAIIKALLQAMGVSSVEEAFKIPGLN